MKTSNRLNNTTPTPNLLYDEMSKMTDTELRIVLIVNRQTFGWVIDKKTGARKIEDWISSSQLINNTGRSNKTVSIAISNCIKNRWIEARDKTGNILDTAKKRSGNKIFFRIGQAFLDDKSCGEISQDRKKKKINLCKKHTGTCEETSHEPVKKIHSTKETLSKETLTKSIGADAPLQRKNRKKVETNKESGNKDPFAPTGYEINEAIKIMSPLHPDWKSWYKPGPMRESVSKLIKFTKEDGSDLTKLVEKSIANRGQQYEVQIHNPCDMVEKYSKLVTEKKRINKHLSSENIVTPGRYDNFFEEQRKEKEKKEAEYRRSKLQIDNNK